MNKYVSHLTQKQLILSDEFINFGNNKVVIESFLENEAKLLMVIEKAKGNSLEPNTFLKHDEMFIRIFDSEEGTIGSKLGFSDFNSMELAESYAFLDTVQVDICEHFIKSGLIEKGLYDSYSQIVSMFVYGNRTIVYEQIDMLLSLMTGHTLDEIQTISIYANAKKLSVPIKSNDDIQAVYIIHKRNCAVGALMNVKKEAFVNHELRKHFNDVVNKLILEVNDKSGLSNYFKKYAIESSSIINSLNDMSTKLQSLFA